MNEQNLQYHKEYSIDVLDKAGDGPNTIIYFFMAEVTYIKVPSGMTVVMIYPYDWNRLMTPWECSPEALAVKPGQKQPDTVTGGGAALAASFLDEIILPTEGSLPHTYASRYIGGYSLGGLMAAYMATVVPEFDGLLSCSGSFWYPDALAYFQSHPYKTRINRAYYSLGTKEAMTLHPLRCEVEDNTREIVASTKLQGIDDTVLTMHDGGHFTNVAGRVEAALAFALGR